MAGDIALAGDPPHRRYLLPVFCPTQTEDFQIGDGTSL